MILFLNKNIKYIIMVIINSFLFYFLYFDCVVCPILNMKFDNYNSY